MANDDAILQQQRDLNAALEQQHRAEQRERQEREERVRRMQLALLQEQEEKSRRSRPAVVLTGIVS